jgi:small subunit ribosomal protein S9
VADSKAEGGSKSNGQERHLSDAGPHASEEAEAHAHAASESGTETERVRSEAKERYYTTGRRKEAVARVFLSPGAGDIMVNGLPVDDYFDRETSRLLIRQPFVATNTVGKYHAFITVRGGGKAGQAGAVQHGIARALAQADASLKVTLRREGMLTRDPRMKERKKYGQRGARRRFQWTKR